MNIFSNNKLASYDIRIPQGQRSGQGEGGNTWTGKQSSWGQVLRGYGVFKERNDSDIESQNAVNDGDATLNIPVNASISALTDDDYQLGAILLGSSVEVRPERSYCGPFLVVKVDTGMNYRTGEVEHLRLHLRRIDKTRSGY